MTLLAFDELFLQHESPGHVECPTRLRVIRDHLKDRGLWDRLERVPTRDATREELFGVHSEAHIERIESLSRRAPLWIDPDTYMNRHTLTAATRAAGAMVELCDAVAKGRDRTGLCLVRPPGHHATRDRAMGFCIFNNVAVAARALRRRVLIVDWDVHHGNGTQDIFSDDPLVSYFSTHRSPFYPGTGMAEERGRGNIFNVPLPAGIGRGEFHVRFTESLQAAVAQSRPEFVLISCGFDAFEGDPIGGLGLIPADFGRLTRTLRQAAPVPVVSVLEGGYAIDALGACAEEHLLALMEE